MRLPSDNQHTYVEQVSTYTDWPFYKMKVDDYIIVEGAKTRKRAMSSAYYIAKTRGFEFQSQKLESNGSKELFKVWRSA